MPSARSTQPRWVTEPTIKPMLAPPRHSRMPTCTRCIGCCAWAPAKDAISMVAAIPPRILERRMKQSPAVKYDASRETGKRRAPGASHLYGTTSPAMPDCLGVSQVAAKALDAFAGVFEIGGLGGVGDPERRAKPERRALHHGDALRLQELGDEILVVADHLAGRRSLADGTGAGRIDVEGALRPRAIDALGLIEHRDHEIAALLEHLVVHWNEILRTVQRFDRGPLRDRRRVRGRLRLDRRHRLDQLRRPAGIADAPAGHAIGF